MQHLADHAALFDVLPAELADDRAAPARANHHSLALQFGQRLPHHVPGRAEALDQLVLDQALACAQPAEQDVLLEVTDDLRERFAGRCHCRSVARG
jgi:hypothetical protein